MFHSRRVFLVLFFTILLHSNVHAWEIKRFYTTVDILPDSQIEVTEAITVDFFDELRHGIYRDIPVDYLDRQGQRLRLRWSLVEVTDARGREQSYQLSRLGRYCQVRIGAPETTVSGEQTYVIRYRVGRAVNYFPSHDELFWNVTGNEWTVPIHETQALVRLPDTVDVSRVRATAFTGSFGSREQEAIVEVFGNRTVSIKTTRALNAYEGLTIVISWPVGLVSRPSWMQKTTWALTDKWPYGLPAIVFVGMYCLWRRRGKEYPGRGSIVVQYEAPEGMTPAEVGALIDDQVNTRDITTTVIDLAIRGYLRIETVESSGEKDYRFVRLKPIDENGNLDPHERLILRGIFHTQKGDLETRLLSELQTKFYQWIDNIENAVFALLKKKDYMDSPPGHVRSLYWILAFIISLSSFLGLGISASLGWGPSAMSWFVGILLCAVVVAIFGYFMPRKTLRGRHAFDHIRGLEEFLSRTDRDRITHMENPQELFERLLPYAMALGVANQWASAFAGLYTSPPEWYRSDFPAEFSSSALISQLSRTTSSMASTFNSAPRTAASSGSSGFSSSGSSGGGFGGGGGGAW